VTAQPTVQPTVQPTAQPTALPTALPRLPAIVEGTVSHDRLAPVRHGFRYRVYQWLVDLDDMPRPPWWLRPFAGFRSADHLGDPDAAIRSNVEAFCAAEAVDVRADRILMLANARVLGHVFDPLSVFWCIAPDGGLTCVVAEVHNTYGERHAYLLDVDETGRASADKAFYVSPFLAVDGRYDLRFGLGSDRVTTTVRLRQDGRVVFSAAFHGAPAPATARRLVSVLVRRPFMTQRVSALIRIQGVRLWLRRLPVVRRAPHHHQEGVR